MRIRSITFFFDPAQGALEAGLDALAGAARSARQAFVAAGYEVESLRLATPAFPSWAGTSRDATVEGGARLATLAASRGFDYVSMGPAQAEDPASFALIPDLLAAHAQIFASGHIAVAGEVHMPAVRAAEEAIARSAQLEAEGFANLRFTALANVPAYSPFFPAAYARSGDAPSFALAPEAADVALTAFESAQNMAEARQALLESLEGHAELLVEIGGHLAAQTGLLFRGLDFSLAPHPSEGRSLVAALEKLGAEPFGRPGSLTAAAFTAATLDMGRWPRTGFNGLMFPVLEDATLGRRVAEGSVTLKDLLLFSAVCGTGLDTVPLPGDASPEQLAAVLTDLAALSCRLNKPLTARLMPIPGKQAGELTAFQFEYFANAAVMGLPAGGLRKPLNGEGNLVIPPRPRV
jgi:uncharacterized protein (UPF0210 family)